MDSESCPVCYERFASSPEALNPFKLTCTHVLCRACIENDIMDDTFYCPECGDEYNGSSVDDIGECVVSVLNVTDSTSGNDSAQLTNLVSRSDSDISVKPRASSLAEFTKQNPVSQQPLRLSLDSAKPTIRSSRSSDSMRFGPCKEPMCQNKACALDVYCLHHSTKKRVSVVEETKIADALANTPLDFVTLEGNSLLLKDKTHTWPDVVPTELIERFRHQKRMEMGAAMELINRAKNILSREPNVLRLSAPVVTVGDIHGQFYDLLNIFEVGGIPGENGMYLFLGDYVDRGSFSCEVILALLAYKVTYPDKVWLIRGNHECASVSGHFGFKEECKMKYGVQVYYRFLLMFQTLPLAAVITTEYGSVFACHGGLSPGVKTLDDLEKIDRFVEPEENLTLLDILWSDPITEERVDSMTDEEFSEFLSIDWRPNPSRGCSYCYGYKAVNEFLSQNNLVCIVRAHEVQEVGYHKHFDPAFIEARMLHTKNKLNYKRRLTNRSVSFQDVKSPETPTSPLTSKVPFSLDSNLSSADQGEFKSGSTSASFTFEEQEYYPSDDIPTDTTIEELRVLQYDCVEHPKPEIMESQMNNHILTVIGICPYMPTSFKDFVRLAIELGPEENLLVDDDVPDDSAMDDGMKRSYSNGSETEDCRGSDIYNEPREAIVHRDSDCAIAAYNEAGGIDTNHTSITGDSCEVLQNTVEKPLMSDTIGVLNVVTSQSHSTDSTDVYTAAGTLSSELRSPNDSNSSQERSPSVLRSRAASAPYRLKHSGIFDSIDENEDEKNGNTCNASEPHVSEDSLDEPQGFCGQSTPKGKMKERKSEPSTAVYASAQCTSLPTTSPDMLESTPTSKAKKSDLLPFSPHEVKRRSNSIKKTSKSISVVDRSHSHFRDDSCIVTRSPEFTLSQMSRSNSSPRGFLSQVRRGSTDARLEGTADAVARQAELENIRGTQNPFIKRAQSGFVESPTNKDGTPTRRSSVSMGHVSRCKGSLLRSNTYTQAHASDAINELHPDQLAKFMHTIKSHSRKFELAETEKPETSVSTLKKMFETRSSVTLHEGDPQYPRMSNDRKELLEFRETIQRGRTSMVASLREKFDRQARENTERNLRNRKTVHRKRSASLDPSTMCVELDGSQTIPGESQSSRSRGRRSSLNDVSTTPRAHSLSPLPTYHQISTSPSVSVANNSIFSSSPRPGDTMLCKAHSHDGSLGSGSAQLGVGDDNVIESSTGRPRASAIQGNACRLDVSSGFQSGDSICPPSPADSVDIDFLHSYRPDSEKKVNFTHTELLALRLLFSLFDRSGSSMIGYEDLVAYGEETGGLAGIRDAADALEIVDIDGDGKIGLLDFIHFAARLQIMYQKNLMKRVLDELLDTATAARLEKIGSEDS